MDVIDMYLNFNDNQSAADEKRDQTDDDESASLLLLSRFKRQKKDIIGMSFSDLLKYRKSTWFVSRSSKLVDHAPPNDPSTQPEHGTKAQQQRH